MPAPSGNRPIHALFNQRFTGDDALLKLAWCYMQTHQPDKAIATGSGAGGLLAGSDMAAHLVLEELFRIVKDKLGFELQFSYPGRRPFAAI